MVTNVRIGVGATDSGRKRDFDDMVTYIVEAERLGVDTVWTAEAWGQDAIAPLAFLAARTERIRLGPGIMQIRARGHGDDCPDHGRDFKRPLYSRSRGQRAAGGRGVARNALQGALDAPERDR